MVTRYLAILFCMQMCCFSMVHSHTIGSGAASNLNSAQHDAYADAHSARLWTNTLTHTTYTASLLVVHNNEVFLEDTKGNVIAIPLAALNAEDRAIAEVHKERVRSINLTPKTSSLQELSLKERIMGSPYLPLAASVLLSVLVCGIAIRLLRRQSPVLRMAVLTLLLGICTAGIVVQSQTTVVSIDEAFAPFSAFIKTRRDANYFYVESNGIPQHTMMVGIRSWQQQVPIQQQYTGSNAWAVPLRPTPAANPVSTRTSLYTGAIALAVNGIPIFNALNNRGDDALLFGELDNWGGHCGRADDYHYHVAPLHLQNVVGPNKPIAYALDGYAIYGSTEPDGSPMKTLDSYNGHTGSDGVYHYHGTTTYPYTCGSMRGTVTVQNDQIVPQPRANPVRAALTPLNGAAITGCTPVGNNGFSLEYTINNQKGYVNYSWTAQGEYSFTYIDVSGNRRTETNRSNAANSAPIILASPQLTLSASAIAFGNLNNGATTLRSYTLAGNGFTAPLTITAPNGTSISTSATGAFTQTLTLSPVNWSLLQTVFVGIAPTQQGAFSGTITHTSNNAALQSVVLSGTVGQATSVRQTTVLPTQAFPNPFREAVTVRWNLPLLAQRVEWRITDAQGRTLLSMPLGAQAAGEHSIEWNGKAADGSPCSTGTYFLSILVNGQHHQTVSLVKQP